LAKASEDVQPPPPRSPVARDFPLPA